MLEAPVPALPGADEQVEAKPSKNHEHAVLLSAIDPRFDQQLMNVLQQVADGMPLVWVPKLSHFSRNPSKLLRVLEFLLAHKATILTTNYLLRPHDVWVRRGSLVPPNNDVRQVLGDSRGLSGAHRAMVQQQLALL